MANQHVYTPLNELTVEKEDWVICVKVHHVWNQSYKNNPTQVASRDMILIDPQGNRIHATVKKNLLPDFNESVKEGNCVEVSTFMLAPYSGKYLMVDHQVKLNFCRATRVKTVAPFEVLGDGYSFIPFDDINAGRLNKDVALDVVGQLVKTGDMCVKIQDGRHTKMLTFVLQDANGTKLDCALWGEFAAQLNTYVENNPSSVEPTLMFIQLAKAKDWQGNVQISNSFFGTKVYINSDIKPILDFKKRLASTSEGSSTATPPPVLSVKTIVEKTGDFYNKFPKKTVDCLRTIKKTTHCVVVGTLLSVVAEDGWFYYICKDCAKPATKIHDVVPGGYLFDCYECGPINETDTRVRTVLRVQDSTGSTTFAMFGDVLARFLKKSEHWLNVKMKKCADPSDVPAEWHSYLNQQIVFKIKVSQFNVDNECAGYTVGRCTDDQEVVAEQLARPIMEEPELHATDSDFVTPTSKVFASNLGDNLSPIPFEDLNMEGSNQKRKSASPPDVVITDEFASKKPFLADG